MKDRWLEDIHDKMTGFEASEPSGLWQRIESGHQGVNSCRRQFFLSWRPWAAAAMLAVTAGLIWLFVDFRHDTTPGRSSSVGIAQIKNGVKTDEMAQLTQGLSRKEFQVDDSIDKSKYNDLESGGSTSAKSYLYQQSDIDRASSDTSMDVVGMTNLAKTEDRPVESTQQIPPTPDNHSAENVPESLEQLSPSVVDEPVYVRAKDNGSRLTVGIYTSGGMTGTRVSGSTNGDYTSSPSHPWTEDNKIPVKNYTPTTLSRSSRGAYDSSIKHNIPLRFGVSLAYNVTPRLAVETGLSYSRLSSDLEHSFYSNNFYEKGEQVLHYIGIPVNLKYRFASWQMLSFYVSAGALTEKLVSGSVSGYTTLSSHRVSSPVTEKTWQWSVNAGAGVQLNITRQIGIYAEPGIGFYFDNGSAVKNVYKDRNLSVTLNMGFRFSLGK